MEVTMENELELVVEENENTEPEIIAEDEPVEAFEEPVDEADNENPEELSEDIEELKKDFPELDISSITELDNPTRYAALRQLGLSVREAYLATAKRTVKSDSRAHLTDSYPRSAKAPVSTMTRSELREARELFSDLSDSQINQLYKKVTNRERT